jgi:hypothetical protein
MFMSWMSVVSDRRWKEESQEKANSNQGGASVIAKAVDIKNAARHESIKEMRWH